MAIPEPVLSFFSGHQRTRPHLVNEPQKAIRSHSCRYRYNGKSGKKQKKKKNWENQPDTDTDILLICLPWRPPLCIQFEVPSSFDDYIR